MRWFIDFLTSSIGKKVIMSLTGLFLILFLFVHLVGNLQLLIDDGGKAFNLYAKKMTTDPLIKTVSYLLYLSILLHAVQGILLWNKNRKSRGQGYAVKVTRGSWATAKVAKNMGWIGTIILVFILIHLYQFWLQMKLGNLSYAEYDGEKVKDLYTIVSATYTNIGFVLFYVISMVVISAHLYHGFNSAFQTLGLNHQKYAPLVKTVGTIYSIVVPLGFAIIPIFMFLANR